MKKLMLVLMACALFTGVFAQVDSTQRKMVPPDYNDDPIDNPGRKNNPPGYQNDSLKNQNRFGSSGNNADTTGRSGRSNNASDMKNDPMYNNPGSGSNTNTDDRGRDNDNRNINSNQGNNNVVRDKNPNNPVKVNPTQDGVMIMDGKVIVIKNGQQSRTTDAVNLLNGGRILADGTLIDRDGTRVKLKEGDYLDFSGKYLHRNPSQIPRNPSTAPVAPSDKENDKVKSKDDKPKDKKDKTMYLVPDSTVKDVKHD